VQESDGARTPLFEGTAMRLPLPHTEKSRCLPNIRSHFFLKAAHGLDNCDQHENSSFSTQLVELCCSTCDRPTSAIRSRLPKTAVLLSAKTRPYAISCDRQLWVDSGHSSRWRIAARHSRCLDRMGAIGALFDAFISGMEDEAQRILVIIGATPEGEKELLGFDNGAGESAHRLALPAA
jgi:hypothetical protein